ncbi:methylated-DNA-protein-cysteine methyltransferase [Desulfurella acetivorans A63]|nr:methylated-DNA-protein-cysteine methyltransferase [Desulfurella acetivorans A63]
MYLIIKTPFSKDLLIMGENKIDRIIFVQKNNTYKQTPLQKMFSMVFNKKDLSFFDYDLLNWEKLSDEQRMVYDYLRLINGIITYKELGEKFGFHQRKIAYLMKKNPFVYVVPCHRVVAKNSIGGYQYSVEFKKELLDFEKNTKRSLQDGFI